MTNKEIFIETHNKTSIVRARKAACMARGHGFLHGSRVHAVPRCV